MKKYLIIAITVVIILSLTACGNAPTRNPDTTAIIHSVNANSAGLYVGNQFNRNTNTLNVFLKLNTATPANLCESTIQLSRSITQPYNVAINVIDMTGITILTVTNGHITYKTF